MLPEFLPQVGSVAVALLTAFALTLLTECGLAYLLGVRPWASLVGIASINLMTNPALGFVMIVVSSLSASRFGILATLLTLEIVVILVEWRLLLRVVGRPARRAFALSALLNSASFLVGLVVLGLPG